ncbi:hypothetical protein [Millisia brevis]|uniref:hypothetical protein n=1 Tax=Millisia brevis TaxID=264148 RepID=UPI0012ED0EA5|nr:hypothetical protein [Millisia brevis]
MTGLVTALAVEEGSRLTSIALRPLAGTSAERDGSIYMHVVMLPGGDNAAAAAGAVATFLPAALSTLEGTSPDGGTWFATFQLVVDDRDWVRTRRLADAAIRRALALAGIDDDTMRGCHLSGAALREEYSEVGDVGDWSLIHLLIGLVLELADRDLAEVVAEVAAEVLAGVEPASGPAVERRHESLLRLLATWAIELGGTAS